MEEVVDGPMYEPNTVVISWTCIPDGFLDDLQPISMDSYVVHSRGQRLWMTLPIMGPEEAQAQADMLDTMLRDTLAGIQLYQRKAFELKGPGIVLVAADGRRNIYMTASGHAVSATFGTLDIVQRNSLGEIVFDSRAERQGRARKTSALARKYRRSDPTAEAILRSFDAAIRDPNDELVHLYEVRERLAHDFRGEKKAIKSLEASEKAWSAFGRLANAPEIRQGRHRGKPDGPMRDATEAELSSARNFAASLIELYLAYRDRKSSP